MMSKTTMRKVTTNDHDGKGRWQAFSLEPVKRGGALMIAMTMDKRKGTSSDAAARIPAMVITKAAKVTRRYVPRGKLLPS